MSGLAMVCASLGAEVTGSDRVNVRNAMGALEACRLTGINPARELFPGSEAGEHHPGVSGRLVADAAIEQAKGRPVAWMPTAKEARSYLESTLGRGDPCVVMGVDGAPQQLAHDLVGLA